MYGKVTGVGASQRSKTVFLLLIQAISLALPRQSEAPACRTGRISGKLSKSRPRRSFELHPSQRIRSSYNSSKRGKKLGRSLCEVLPESNYCPLPPIQLDISGASPTHPRCVRRKSEFVQDPGETRSCSLLAFSVASPVDPSRASRFIGAA